LTLGKKSYTNIVGFIYNIIVLFLP